SARPGGMSEAADIGMFASAGNGGGSDRVVSIFDNWTLTEGNGSDEHAIAIEYFHAAFGHYFITAIPGEIAQLDAGVFSGWARTGQAFDVYAGTGAGR